jgi:hypothetical protein
MHPAVQRYKRIVLRARPHQDSLSDVGIEDAAMETGTNVENSPHMQLVLSDVVLQFECQVQTVPTPPTVQIPVLCALDGDQIDAVQLAVIDPALAWLSPIIGLVAFRLGLVSHGIYREIMDYCWWDCERFAYAASARAIR